MRILVVWDQPSEAELLALYLNLPPSSALVLDGEADFTALPDDELAAFDVLLLPAGLRQDDSVADAVAAFRLMLPHCPVVVACRDREVRHLPALLRLGVSAVVPRDETGDFMFLLQATLEAALEGARVQDERRVALAVRREFDAVRQLQTAILNPDLPQPAGYRLAVRCEPVPLRDRTGTAIATAGGDYYDAIPTGSNRLTLLVADATGHGVRASLAIVALDALLRAVPDAKYRDPAGLLAEMNRLFCRQRLNRIGGGFVTAVAVTLELHRGRFLWSTAGHPAPLLCGRNTTGELTLSDQPGPPLGVDPRVTFPTGTGTLTPGGRLLLYTDGLTEAASATTSKIFGADALRAIFAESRHALPHEALAEMFRRVDAHSAPAGRSDDATGLLVERLG